MDVYMNPHGGESYRGEGMALEAGLYFSQGFRLSPAAYLVLTLLQVMVAGGTIFGWQALLPVLYEEGHPPPLPPLSCSLSLSLSLSLCTPAPDTIKHATLPVSMQPGRRCCRCCMRKASTLNPEPCTLNHEP